MHSNRNRAPSTVVRMIGISLYVILRDNHVRKSQSKDDRANNIVTVLVVVERPQQLSRLTEADRANIIIGLVSSVCRAPARFIQNLSKIVLCTQSVSLVVHYMIFVEKSRIPLWCIPCLFPGCIVTWAWSLAKGQYMVSWLLTGAPEQRYWQNMETANIGLVSSVGRTPARQSGGHRFKSRSSKLFFVHPKCI